MSELTRKETALSLRESVPLPVGKRTNNLIQKEDGASITANALHPGVILTNLFWHNNVINGLVNVLGTVVLKKYSAVRFRDFVGFLDPDPFTCVFTSTARDHPIHLWDASSGQLRCTYRAYDAVDEITAAFSIAFNPSGNKRMMMICP